MTTEADTCRIYITPQITAAGWDAEPHSIAEQRTFTDGRITVVGKNGATRGKPKRADYILRFRRDFPIAVVEAKPESEPASTGLQQAKEYAEALGLKFAYATNGHEIIEFDFLKGTEKQLDRFPTPEELWSRLGLFDNGSDARLSKTFLSPSFHSGGRSPRYYQELAVQSTLGAILGGKRRVLLNLATGTGKTLVAFQLCWKLWNSGWNAEGDPRRRLRVLYLADRITLVDDPKDKEFSPFGDARWKIESGETNKSREIYFATYQTIAKDEHRPGLYKDYDPHFFDLVIVDECHRGSARDESNWREILEYFHPAFQLGMTATPQRDDNRDTYRYFGAPVYTYSLRQGIEDGFLAPYRVTRVVTNVDALGWRPGQEDRDRYGRRIPAELYQTPDFEREVSLLKRTGAIAKHLSDFLRQSDRFAKTIVYCVDQEHALDMRAALTNLNSDLVMNHPEYACRITADEGALGRAALSRFQDVESIVPVIVTTSQLLTTGVDVPTCKNIVIARVVGSMTEFKQIIGRGTRVRDDYGKLFFNIVDYTGSASRLFADPEFDGDPAAVVEETANEQGDVETSSSVPPTAEPLHESSATAPAVIAPDVPWQPRKNYFDGGEVHIVASVVEELDSVGNRLRVVQLSDYTAERVRILVPHASDMKGIWTNLDSRAELVNQLEARGVDLTTLAETLGEPEADAFDLICHLAYNAPLRTRRERARTFLSDRPDFFGRYEGLAREVLEELLRKYESHGVNELQLPDALKVPPISSWGNVPELSAHFGGPIGLRTAIQEMQSLLYA